MTHAAHCTECESTEVATCTICGKSVCPAHRAGSGRLADGYQCATKERNCWAERARSHRMTDEELFQWLVKHGPKVSPEELRSGYERLQAAMRRRDNVANDAPRYRVEIIAQSTNESVDVLEYARIPVKGDHILFAKDQWEVRTVLLWPAPLHVDATVWVTPVEFPQRAPDHGHRKR